MTRRDYTPHPYQQIAHRPAFDYPIIARDTLDELVQVRHATKREVQDLLMEAATRK